MRFSALERQNNFPVFQLKEVAWLNGTGQIGCRHYGDGLFAHLRRMIAFISPDMGVMAGERQPICSPKRGCNGRFVRR